MFLQWNHLDLNPSSWNLLWNYFKAATMYHPEPFLLQGKRSQILFCYSMVFDKPVLSLISISQTYKTFNNPSTQTELIRLEKAMAPHSSTLAWKIPWTEEPGGLQSMGSLGVGHDRATSLSLLCYFKSQECFSFFQFGMYFYSGTFPCIPKSCLSDCNHHLLFLVPSSILKSSTLVSEPVISKGSFILLFLKMKITWMIKCYM